MMFFRLALMALGLVLGYSGGQILALSGPPETAAINTVSLMLAGALSAKWKTAGGRERLGRSRMYNAPSPLPPSLA